MDGRGWPLKRGPLPPETSMPGVLAAGDVRHASVKRVASAVGEGAIGVQLVHSLFADEGPHLRTPTETAASAASP
jgi:thioredoxin reductase (NADPH)